jgi:hypothetical protein
MGQREVGCAEARWYFQNRIISFNGVNVTEIWTFLNTHGTDGVIQGVELGDLTC